MDILDCRLKNLANTGVRVFTIAAAVAISCAGQAAELVTLSPENYGEYAPQGEVSGAFFGDYVLRNEQVSVCVADPFLLSGRSASRWAITKVGGAVIALTPRNKLDAATPTAYYPGPARFKPDAPAFRNEFDAEAANPPWQRPERAPVEAAEVALDIGAYEVSSGKALAELDKLPTHLRGAPKPTVRVVYRLRDGEPFVRVSVTYTNPTDTAFTHTPVAVLRADGDWKQGVSADHKLFGAYHCQSRATTIIEAVNHKLAWTQAGAQAHLTQVALDDAAAFTLPPGGSISFETRLYPAASLEQANRIAQTINGEPLFETPPPAPPATLRVSVSGDNGNPMPHKIAVYERDAAGFKRKPPLVLWGGADGLSSAALAPGEYWLLVSAGNEFEIAERDVTIAPGKVAEFAVALKHSVTTPGWISAETHNHTARSGASEIYYVYPYKPNTTTDGGSAEPVADKVLSLAAEHIEFAPAMEHNFSFTYAAKIAELGLRDHLATSPGLGLSAGRRHTLTHQNVFPVPYVKGAQDGGVKQREEHIDQLKWLRQWKEIDDAVIQIVVPKDDELEVTPEMEVLDVVALEPIVARQPLPDYDNRILDWLAKLNMGYRLPAVCNAGRFASYQETGRYRNYVRSQTDLPGEIDPLRVARALRDGEVVMTTGPFMERTIRAAATGAAGGNIHTTLSAPGGEIVVAVRVLCPGWITCDRVQVLVNGEAAAERTRGEDADLFDHKGAAFAAEIPLKLKADGHVIVVASGMGRDLHDKSGDPSATRLHVAVSNPVFVDIDGNGYSVTSPLDATVSPMINFIESILAAPGAAPGRVRVNLFNASPTETAVDNVELLARPPDALKFISPRVQSYTIPPRGEVWLDWEVAFADDFLRGNYPVRSDYNIAKTFGVYIGRSLTPPGRNTYIKWMFVDHPVPTLPPMTDMAAIAGLLEHERPMIFRWQTSEFGQIRTGISGDNMLIRATVYDKQPQQRKVVGDGSCLEIFGANVGYDAVGDDAVPGGCYDVKQVYLEPPVAGKAARCYKRAGRKGTIEEAPEIRANFADAPNGYEVSAIVPLALLGVNVDRVKRTCDFTIGSVEADGELYGKIARAGRFLFEARVNIPGVAGSTAHVTLFGSSAPHFDTSAFGVLRLVSPVGCDIAIESPLPPDADGDAAKARVTLTNTTDKTLSDTITLTVDPLSAASVAEGGAWTYTLKAGESASRTFVIAPTGRHDGKAVYLVVPRSPLGQVAAAPSPRLPIGARALPDIGACELDDLPQKLAKVKRFKAKAGENDIAEVRLARAGAFLALLAMVKEPQIRQAGDVWRGSDIEVFGAAPGGGSDSIGQVFLVPGTGDLPSKGLHKKGAEIVPEPAIRLASAVVADGYRLTALIPLDLLKLEAEMPEIALEVQIASLVDGKQTYTTIFGSARAYLDTSRYGVFRAVSPMRAGDSKVEPR